MNIFNFYIDPSATDLQTAGWLIVQDVATKAELLSHTEYDKDAIAAAVVAAPAAEPVAAPEPAKDTEPVVAAPVNPAPAESTETKKKKCNWLCFWRRYRVAKTI